VRRERPHPRRFAFGKESVWLRLGGEPATSVWSIHLDFLGSWPFRSEGSPHEDWISLDFLVGIETYQWVTRLGAKIIFPRAFLLALEAREWERAVEAMRRHRIVHGASLA
jgi:hypothetical protein